MADATFVDTCYVIRVEQYEHAWPCLSSLFNDAGEVSSDHEETTTIVRCFIYTDVATAVLTSSFTEPTTTIGVLTYDPVISIDNGDSITRNVGTIFPENDLTRSLTDIDMANKVGVAFTVIRSARMGQPNWIFKSAIDRFSRAFAYNPDEIRSNFAAVIAKIQRTSSPITRFNPNPRAGASFYFGLGDPPSALHTPLGEPYGSPAWIEVAGWGSAPISSSKLDVSSLACDHRAYWVHLWVRRGQVVLTFNNRDVAVNSYDGRMGTLGSGSESGSDGDFRIDEFDYDGGLSFTPEDLEASCFFGFTLPATGSTPSDNIEYRVLRVHPAAIRIMGIDTTAQFRYAFERVGDSRTGEYKVNRAGEAAMVQFRALATEAPPVR